MSYTDPSQLVGAAGEDVGLAVVVSTGGHSFLAIDSLCCCAGDNLSECHGDAIISKTSNPRFVAVQNDKNGGLLFLPKSWK